MRKYIVLGVCALFMQANTILAQAIPQDRVPAVVTDSFQRAFSDARSVEWHMDGSFFKVKFETGEVSTHHKVWYNSSGEWVRHEEKILKGDLPPRVLDSMYVHFSGYKLDDEIEKLTERHRVTYTLELTKDAEEWKVVYDSDGVMISKRED